MFSVLPGVCIWVAVLLRFGRTEQLRDGAFEVRLASAPALRRMASWTCQRESLALLASRPDADCDASGSSEVLDRSSAVSDYQSTSDRVARQYIAIREEHRA